MEKYNRRFTDEFNDRRIEKITEYQQKQKGFIAGVIFSASLVATLIGFALTYYFGNCK